MKNRIRNQILSFAQLEAAVDDIWNKGYIQGEADKVQHLHCDILYHDLNVDENDSVDYTKTFTEKGSIYTEFRLYTPRGGGHGGDQPTYEITRASGGTVTLPTQGVTSVSPGDTLRIRQYSAETGDPEEGGYALVVFYN